MQLYDTVANLLEKNVIRPDLVIYLQADTKTLMNNIANRGREMEEDISKDYIDALGQVYTEYFFRYQDTPLVIINPDNIDFVEIKILDKVSSKTSKLTLDINKETKFENLIIKVLKCKNSEFDDNPEVTAYMQVQDITLDNNDQVFVFNGWTFSSSPSITLFDHPVYDIWLSKCY